jgi:hypothetical protein
LPTSHTHCHLACCTWALEEETVDTQREKVGGQPDQTNLFEEGILAVLQPKVEGFEGLEIVHKIFNDAIGLE